MRDHTCNAPYNNVELVEAAIEEHYKTIRLTPEYIEGLRETMHSLVADSETATRLHHQRLKKQLKGLDVKEDNLLDLAASGTLAKDKIKQRLRDIELQRTKLERQLESVVDDLSVGASYIDLSLKLLEDPYELYQQASDETRRRLNQAILTQLFVHSEEVTEHSMTSPLAELHAAETGWKVYRAGGNADDASQASLQALRVEKGETKKPPCWAVPCYS